MTTQYFVRFFCIHLKPRVESFWGVLSCCLTLSILFNFWYKKIKTSGKFIFKTGNIPSTWSWRSCFDLNARIQHLTWSLIFYGKYSTSLSTIVLVVLTTANFGGFSNFSRYYTRSQAGKSTGYRPTLKPLNSVCQSCKQ
jgi:hypothetical protein